MDEGTAIMMKSIAESIDGVGSSLDDIKTILADMRDAMCEENGGNGIYIRGDINTQEA